jgi:hypothetical protein
MARGATKSAKVTRSRTVKRAPKKPKRGKSATPKRKPPVGVRTRTRKNFPTSESEV